MSPTAQGHGGTPGGGVVLPVENPDFGVRRFAEGANALFIRTIALDTARAEALVKATGDFVYVLDASTNAASIDIKFNGQDSDAIPFSLGRLVGGTPFDRWYVTHTAQPGAWVKLMFGVAPGIFVLNPSANISSFDLVKATNLQTVADVTVSAAALTAIRSSSSVRRKIHIKNMHASAAIRIGDSLITATRGIKLDPGETITFETTDFVFGFGLGTAVDVSMTEEVD